MRREGKADSDMIFCRYIFTDRRRISVCMIASSLCYHLSVSMILTRLVDRDKPVSSDFEDSPFPFLDLHLVIWAWDLSLGLLIRNKPISNPIK